MHLAIIGAGIAGTAAAWALREAPCDVTLFEKSRGFSGRAATRRKHGAHYDHGANYFKTDTDRLRHLIQEVLPADELEDIGRDVWTFNGHGEIGEGDPAHNQAPKWTYRSGISTLGKLLFQASGADVRRETRIARLERTSKGWDLVTTEDETVGPFEAVLVTPPAPQSAELVEASKMDEALRSALVAGLAKADYRTQLTVVLAYERPVERPGDFFGLVNTDGEHGIAWLSFEEDKPGHVPRGQSLIIAQMAPAWSEPRYNRSVDDLAPEAARLAGSLLGTDLDGWAWADRQGWRYALPKGPVNTDALEEAAASGIFFAGDALVGKGRVERALDTGLDAAERIRQQMDV